MDKKELKRYISLNEKLVKDLSKIYTYLSSEQNKDIIEYEKNNYEIKDFVYSYLYVDIETIQKYINDCKANIEVATNSLGE